MLTVYIGIDPGQSGGIAWLTGGAAQAQKMPETPADLHDLLAAISRFPCHCYIERVGPARGRDGRKQGVSSAFKFGYGCGVLDGLLTALKIPFERISPQVWQRDMRCLTGGDKNVSKRAAQQLFPQLKITHAIADALLLAELCRRDCRKVEATMEKGA